MSNEFFVESGPRAFYCTEAEWDCRGACDGEHFANDPNAPACGIDGEEEVDCWNCYDKGFTVTVGGLQMPCPDCKTGDMFFYHEREKDLAAMVHVDDDPIQDHAMTGYDETDE